MYGPSSFMCRPGSLMYRPSSLMYWPSSFLHYHTRVKSITALMLFCISNFLFNLYFIMNKNKK